MNVYRCTRRCRRPILASIPLLLAWCPAHADAGSQQDPKSDRKIIHVTTPFSCRYFITPTDARALGFSTVVPYQCCKINLSEDPLQNVTYAFPQHQWRLDDPDGESGGMDVKIEIWDTPQHLETTRGFLESQVKSSEQTRWRWARTESIGTTPLYVFGNRGNITLLFLKDCYSVWMYAQPPKPREARPGEMTPDSPPEEERHPDRTVEDRAKRVAVFVHDKLSGKAKSWPETSPEAEKVRTIRVARKGTFDLAGTAEDLWRKVGKEFRWTQIRFETKGTYDGIKNVEDWDACRRMNCYQFVHYVAWLCSNQPTGKDPEDTEGKTERPTATSTEKKMATSTTEWDRKSKIPRGELVFGVHRLNENNDGGFYHVGISLGDGTVISLGSGQSGEELAVEKTEDAFPRYQYSSVYYGPHNWRHLK